MRERELYIRMKRGGRCPMVATYNISWGVVEDLTVSFHGKGDHSHLVADLDEVASEIEELEWESATEEMSSSQSRAFRSRCAYMNGPSAEYPYA